MVVKNHVFDAFLKDVLFGGKIGVAATVEPRGLGPQDPTKKLAQWLNFLGQPLSEPSVIC